ncbi:MAG: hybrid sensor histidine kinase/response regulator [Magnetococcales bacterium]|nr:response regulator [Magnetococcales bacterium]NGZ26706.1 hybrid sensor histidine kinase/response regulator [Magnetococcales bacterium]
MKLLIVDDTTSIRTMVRTIFEMFDHAIIEAKNGAEALTLAQQQGDDLDVILLDQTMPDMDGLETFEELKKIIPQIPIIMITAHGSIPLATEFMRRGGADFVEKPFHPEILELRVRTAMQHHALFKRAQKAEAAQAAAQEMTKRSHRLLSNLSHNLRSPLSGALGLLPLVRQAVAKGEMEKANRLFTLMDETQSTFLHFVEQIETLARLEMGNVQRQVRQESPESPLLALLERMRPRFLAEQKEVHYRQNGEVTASFDEDQLCMAVEQLLENARRFTPSQGVVELVVRQEEKGCLIQVLDQGPGIPAGEEESIFELLTESSRTATGAGGRGLGLTIVRSVCQLNGWGQQAGNRPQGGAEFTLFLPNL